MDEGRFKSEIAPVTVKTRKGEHEVAEDEGPGSADLEKIPTLKPAFKKDGTVTAASSSSISDGAATLILMRESDARVRGANVLATIIGHSGFAHEPEWFTTAPVFAIKTLHEKLGWNPDIVDLYEINEAFACVTMAAMQDVGIDHKKVNVNGGACALGHPIGASGVNIPVDLDAGVDIGTYVKRAQAAMDKAISDGALEIPAAYYTTWSGQYQFMEEVNKRLQIIIPITLALIFLLIYFNMKNVTETLITMVALPFALVGGVWYIHVLGYNLSVAVGIGFIALAGLAAETSIIMHVYMENAYKKREQRGRVMSDAELNDAILEGAVMRVRPKIMTVATTIMALVPIMWATGAGSGPMKRLAAPMIGGLITSTIHTLILIPVYFAMFKQFQLRRTRRKMCEAGVEAEDTDQLDGSE